MQQKLLDFQEMYDSYQRYIQLGKKFDGLAKDFSNNKKKKLLVDELMKMVITENVKRQPAPKKTEAKKHKQEQGKKKQLENEVIQKVAKIREQKKKNPKPVVAPKPKVTLKKNDRVRLMDSKSIGTIDQIEKGKATVNYGMFTTIVSVEQLEKV